MNDSTRKGIALALTTAFISGISVFYNKLVLVSGVDPTTLNIVKNGTAGIVLTLIILATGKAGTLRRISVSRWGRLIAIALIGGSIPFILYFTGLKLIPAANGQLIHKTMFLWAAFLAIPLFKERIHPLQLLAYAVIAWSNLLIGGMAKFAGNTGELLVLSATLLWSVETVLVRHTTRGLDSTVAAWSRMFLGTLILVAIAAFTGDIGALARLNPQQVIRILGSGMLLTGYVITFYKALSLAPVTLVTSILILATPITNVLSAAFITGTLPASQLTNAAGSVIGVTAMLVVWYFQSRTPRESAT